MSIFYRILKYSLSISLLFNGFYAESQDVKINCLTPQILKGTLEDVVYTDSVLGLDATDAGVTKLYGFTPEFTEVNTVRMRLSMDFNPSESNAISIMVFGADSTFQEGMFLSLGESGDEDVWRVETKNNGVDHLLFEGRFEYGIQKEYLDVLLKKEGEIWELFTGESSDSLLQLEGSFSDDVDFEQMYFGVEMKYTSTRKDKFQLLSYQVELDSIRDILAPFVMGCVSTMEKFSFVFNEAVNGFNEVVVGGVTMPFEVENNELVLSANGLLDSLHFDFMIKGISDQRGNDTTINVYCDYKPLQTNDIVLTELMFDPIPVIGLSDCEYIELYNNSNRDLSIEEMELVINDEQILFNDVYIKDSKYVVLYSGECSFGEFSRFVDEIDFENGANEAHLVIKDDTISSFYYDPIMFDDVPSGGRSVERSLKDLNCHSNLNYYFSKALLGGTPGVENSNRFDVDSFRFKISSDGDNDFSIFSSVYLENLIISLDDSIVDDKAGYLLSIELLDDSVPHTLHLITKEACSVLFDTTFVLQHTSMPTYHDLLITEWQFDALSSCYEFIELMNNSKKPLNLEDCLFSFEKDDYQKVLPVSEEYYLLDTNEVVVIVRQKECIVQAIENDFGSLSDDGAEFVLFNKLGQILDSAYFSLEAYNGLVDDFDGCSVQRKDVLSNGGKNEDWRLLPLSQVNPNYFNPLHTLEFKFDLKDDVVRPLLDEKLMYQIDVAEELLFSAWVFDVNGKFIDELNQDEVISVSSGFEWSIPNNVAEGIYFLKMQFLNNRGDVEYRKCSFTILNE